VNWGAGTKTVRIPSPFCLTARRLADRDNNTTVEVERTVDENKIRAKIDGFDVLLFDKDGSNIGRLVVGASLPTSPDTPLHVHPSSAGAVSAPTNSVLNVEKDGDVGISLLCPTDQAAQVLFGDPSDNDRGFIQYSMSASANADKMQFYTAATLRFTIDGTGAVFVGSGTSNSRMTIGLTINQGANDDEIVALKSSDVSHGVTGQTETDTFGEMRKFTDTTGGLSINGYSEAAVGINLRGVVTTEDTTKGTGALANIMAQAYLKSGTSVTDHGANVNVFGARSASTMKFIVDQEGDLHVDGSTSLTNFDVYDDALVARAFDLVRDPEAKSVIRHEFDQYVTANREYLMELGILGKVDPADPGDPMVCITQLQRLHNGAIWQGYVRWLHLVEVLQELFPGLSNKLAERLNQAKLPPLPMLTHGPNVK
jgi:hypothetical protein